MISRVELLAMRRRLLAQRGELLARMQHLDTEWDELGEPESELEEMAQKTDLSSLYDQLEKRELDQVEAIDLALGKLAVGAYGRCERCVRDIAGERLEALPSARLCSRCAKKQEEAGEGLPAAGEILAAVELPPNFAELDAAEIVEAVMEYIRTDAQVDLDELEIVSRGGVIYLEGVVPSEGEHRILLRLLTDDLGFRAVVDHLRITDLPWEREERTPGRAVSPAPQEGAERSCEDLFEMHEKGGSYTAPQGPPPDEE